MRRICAFAILMVGMMSAVRHAHAHQPSVGDLLNPFPEKVDFEGSASMVAQNGGQGVRSGLDLRLTSFESAGRYQLINTYPVNPTIGYTLFHLDIASADPRLPAHLTDFTVGIASPLAKISDDWFLAAGLGIGYAGDSLFSQSHAYYGEGAILIGRQLGESGALVFSLEYNGNRMQYPDIPIPSVTLAGDLLKNLSVTVGFAFVSVEWQPTDRLELSLDYEVPEALELSARFKVTDQLKLYAAYHTIQDAFHADDLPERRRILFFQRRIELGVKVEPIKGLDLVVGAGYAFDTRFEVGFDDSKTRLIDRGNDSAYLRLGVEWRF